MPERHLIKLFSLSSSIEVRNLILYIGIVVIHVINLNCFDKLYYMMQMDARKRWMYDVDRRTSEYMVPLKKFLDVAEANRVNNFMPCPCVKCRNITGYSKRYSLHSHLVRHGFMPSYYCWTRHGERGVMMEDNEEEEDDDIYPMFPEGKCDTAMDDNEEEGADEQRASDEPTNGLGRVISDAKQDCETK